MKKVCVVGEGAWGTAVATVLAHNGYTVNLWCHHDEVKETIEQYRCNNKYLPDVQLAENIVPTTDMQHALADVEWVFEAIPVKFLRSVLEQIKPYYTEHQKYVVLSKGVEKDTQLLPSQMIKDVLGQQTNVAVFSGPSFAHDLAQKQLTAGTVAADDATTAEQLQKLVANDYVRPYTTQDIIGTQCGGAFKNVITLMVGMLDGAGYIDNTKAFMLTRGLQEVAQLVVALGGEQKTVYGLSGVGDLVLTAMGSRSRNLEVGKQLGQGKKLATILEQTGYITEGVNTVQSVNTLAQKFTLNLPICTGVYDIIFDGLPLQEFLDGFMQRPLIKE